jgi:two-component system, sensor histidine kinase AauS
VSIVIAVIAAVVFGALGLAFGRARGRASGLEQARAETVTRLRSLVDALKRGRTLPGIQAGSPEAELQSALQHGWSPREVERAAALREAIGRVSGFLQKSVRGPLTGFGPGASAGELRERIGRALGALEDLDFFVQETSDVREGADLVALCERLSKEFVADQGVGVRLAMSDPKITASVNSAALLDALYLVLHNAARFGKGGTIDLSVAGDGGRATITVRDHGPGFSEEAFRRAFDPFYSTSEEGLGLGLPHARKVVERMGGTIELRNVPDGGAEVQISLPAT